MTETWAGSISTDDPATTVNDIELWHQNPCIQSPITCNAKLRFLSVVHVPSIPLYLAAGPSLVVSTNNEDSAAWLSGALLPFEDHEGFHNALSEPWRGTIGSQSEHGILVGVDDERATGGTSRQVTEVLLYAAMELRNGRLPTPPTSSSPLPLDETYEDSPTGLGNIKVYALPLSSHIINNAANAVSVVTPPPEDPMNPTPAYFLPQPVEQSQADQRLHQKRQSMSALFDDATKKRRKLKGQGGESIAQTMANIDRPVSWSDSIAEVNLKRQGTPYTFSKDAITRKELSRTSSTASAEGQGRTRPSSRSGFLVNSKRSSLRRVESAISPRDSPTFSEADDGYADHNKAALTKVVMAAMRLYGMQQKRKHGKGLPPDSFNSVSIANERDEEYKLVYHQTFKAATFAFRRQLYTLPIPQEAMRDVVDGLLHMFCTDPMLSTTVDDDVTAGFGTQGSDTVCGFDLPSHKNPSPVTLQGFKHVQVD